MKTPAAYQLCNDLDSSPSTNGHHTVTLHGHNRHAISLEADASTSAPGNTDATAIGRADIGNVNTHATNIGNVSAEPVDIGWAAIDPVDIDPDDLGDRDLFSHVTDIEDAIQTLHAKSMIPHAAAMRRRAHRAQGYRSNATGLAARTRQSRAQCARSSNQAVTLVDHLPKIYGHYSNLLMNRSQIELLCRLHDNSILKPFVQRDQDFFLGIGHEPWPIFRTLANAWARATLEREDPDDPAGKVFKNRKLVWGKGLDRETLGEFHMPNELFEQFKEIVTPFYDALLREEIREARAAAGEDPAKAPAEGEFLDLARSNSQRWLDALMAALRVRGSLLRNLKQQAIQDGGDPEDELQIDLDDADAGVAAEVVIIADQETLEREQARQLGHSLPPRTAESKAHSRCETLSGMPVSPATALLYAQLGSFRRMVMKPDNLDFTMSRKARLFKGAKRTGLIARDRHCQGPGCDTAGKFCQGDHILEYSKGGPTIPTNGELLCGPCNRHKEWLRTNAIR